MAKINGTVMNGQDAIEVEAAGKSWTAKLASNGYYRVYVNRKSVWVGKTPEEVQGSAATKIEAAMGIAARKQPKLTKTAKPAATNNDPIIVQYEGHSYKVRWKANAKLASGGFWAARVKGVDLYCGIDRAEVRSKFVDAFRAKLVSALETAVVATNSQTLGAFIEREQKAMMKTATYTYQKKATHMVAWWKGRPKSEWSQNWDRVKDGDEKTMRLKAIETGWSAGHWDTPITKLPSTFWSDWVNIVLGRYAPSSRQTFLSFAKRIVEAAEKSGLTLSGSHVLNDIARSNRFTTHVTTDSNGDDEQQRFTITELRRIFKQLDKVQRPEFWKALCLVSLNGAMEQADLVAMTWDHFDEGMSPYKGVRMKTGSGRTFVPWKRTVTALEALRHSYGSRNTSPYVFLSDRYGKPYAGWNRRGRCTSLPKTFREQICQPAGVHEDGRNFYGFRRSFSHLAQDWPNHKQHVVDVVMGHNQTSNIQALYRGTVTVDAVRECCEYVESRVFG